MGCGRKDQSEVVTSDQRVVATALSEWSPTHISHKRVESYPIAAAEFEEDGSGKVGVDHPTRGYIVVPVPPKFLRNPGDVAEGDYLVRYEPTDEQPHGYLSYSPRAVFEAGYSAIVPAEHRRSYEGGGRGLTFGQAIEQARADNAIARDGWNGKGMFVVLMPPLFLPPFNTQDTARKVNDRTAKWIGEDQPLDCQPYFSLYTADKKWQPGWNPSTPDVLADDWCVVQGAARLQAA